MALDATRLRHAIRASLAALPHAAPGQDADGTDLDGIASAIASAVVSEITGHADVTPTGLVAPSGGGPVTGTGTIA